MKEKLKLYSGYFIIGILSLISIFFLPMIGSSIGLGFNFPITAAGWLVWSVSKLAVILINMLLFDQFVKQAKINIKDNENFLAAQAIFNELHGEEEEKLLYPKQFLSKLYRSKGSKVFITTALSVVALSNAILTFDWVTMLTYTFTVVTGIIYGWITMATVETYWTEDYYKLALKVQKENQEKAAVTAPSLTPEEYVENVNQILEESQQ